MKRFFHSKARGEEVVCLDNIVDFWKSNDFEDGFPKSHISFLLSGFGSSETDTFLDYDSEEVRDEDFIRLCNISRAVDRDEARMNSTTKGTRAMFEDISADIKEFLAANKNMLYTLGLIFLIDHFFFEGSFRTRLKSMFESLLKKTEDAIKSPKKNGGKK